MTDITPENEILVKITNHYKEALELRKQGHNADTIIQACIRWANEEKIEWTKVKEMANGTV